MLARKKPKQTQPCDGAGEKILKEIILILSLSSFHISLFIYLYTHVYIHTCIGTGSVRKSAERNQNYLCASFCEF